MKPLDDREQRYAYTGVGLAAAVSVALWAPAYDEQAALALSGIGLVMSFLLAVAAKRRHRLFTGLACVLLAFGPWGMAWVVGLPYLMFAAWLALKSNRLQPPTEHEVDENGEIIERPALPPRPVRERPVRPPRQRRRRRGADEDEAVEATTGAPAKRTPPPPSKRYTPPNRQP